MKHHRYREIMIGILASLTPFIALAYRFNLEKAFIIFLVVVVTLLSAKLIIFLFLKRSKLAKVTAIATQGNLVFILFMPNHLKQQINDLEDKEKLTTKNSADVEL